MNYKRKNTIMFVFIITLAVEYCTSIRKKESWINKSPWINEYVSICLNSRENNFSVSDTENNDEEAEWTVQFFSCDF